MAISNYRRIASALGIIVAATGLLVLFGWQFDIDWFKRPVADMVCMNPVTALAFIIAGVPVLFFQKTITAVLFLKKLQ